MSEADKLRAGLARIVGGEIEGLELMGSHTYRVTKVYAEGRCDLAPIESRMQPLGLVDQWLAGGEVTTPVPGMLCCVEFRDLKHDRPIITRWQPLRNTGGTPTKAALDATAIELGGASAAPLALASLVAANFTTIKTAVNAAVIVPGDGGAALKAAIMSAFATVPASMATSKVKGV